MKNQIIPSIIARNQKEFDERISKVISFSSTIQLDVMDGKFVKNKSLLFNFKIPASQYKKINYEAHLMMKNPVPWIKKNHKKFQTIIIHAESEDIEKTIMLLKEIKKKIGIAMNPDTFMSRLQFIPMKYANFLLIMTVQPGKYGAEFLPLMINKVAMARKLYPGLYIEVDGGISDNNIVRLKHAGANIFVIGSFLQNSKDVKSDWKRLERKIK